MRQHNRLCRVIGSRRMCSSALSHSFINNWEGNRLIITESMMGHFPPWNTSWKQLGHEWKVEVVKKVKNLCQSCCHLRSGRRSYTCDRKCFDTVGKNVMWEELEVVMAQECVESTESTAACRTVQHNFHQRRGSGISCCTFGKIETSLMMNYWCILCLL